MKLAEQDVRASARPSELRCAPCFLCAWLSFASSAFAQAQPQPASAVPTGPYAPLGVDLLLQSRPEEGLLIVHSGYRNSPYIDADAVVFMGASQFGREGDVLAVNLGFRDPHGYAQARVGRFILSTGAVRPVQIDGASVLARAPTGSSLEVFGGLPVVPELGPRPVDWIAGARAAQWLFEQRLAAGVSYVQRRDDGELSNEELGADLSAIPTRWLSLSALGAWDLLQQGLAETRVSVDAHEDRNHAQLFASYRVASRLLPATSLFSVISAAPSDELGSDLLYNAFPRLDIGATGALEALDGHLGYRSAARASLRLGDDPSGGELGVEATRRKLGHEGWTGGSVRLEFPVIEKLRAHARFELVGADHPGDRGELWPWARVGASYAFSSAWLLAAALSARATPQYKNELIALVRVGYNAMVTP